MSPILESRSRGTLRQVVTSPPRAQRFFSPEAEQAMSQWTRRAPHLYTPEQRVQQQEGSSNGSLTQEQVMAEVQKQVKFEMRAHEAERYQLAEENNQLKTGNGFFCRSRLRAGKVQERTTQVEFHKDPREAITLVVAAAILVDYLDLPAYLGVIFLYRNRALLLKGPLGFFMGVLLQANRDPQYLAEIHSEFVQSKDSQCQSMQDLVTVEQVL